MKRLLYILLFIPSVLFGQTTINLSPDSTLYDLHVLGASVNYCDTVTNLVDNCGVILGGVECTTDWVDTDTDGVADNWVHSSGVGTPSIVTGNGFVGNAQRLEHTNGTNSYLDYDTGVTAEVGKTYRITGKIRNYSDGVQPWRCYLRTTSDILKNPIPDNTGNAIAFDWSVVAAAATDIKLRFYMYRDGITGDWIEIDEVILYKLD